MGAVSEAGLAVVVVADLVADLADEPPAAGTSRVDSTAVVDSPVAAADFTAEAEDSTAVADSMEAEDSTGAVMGAASSASASTTHSISRVTTDTTALRIIPTTILTRIIRIPIPITVDRPSSSVGFSATAAGTALAAAN